MKTTVDKLSETRTKLTIEVTPEELKPSVTKAYGQIAEQINIPGFRKGKVPPAIVDQRVGRAAVIEQAINEGLDGFYRSASEEHDLKPLGRPEADISAWPSDKDFSGDLVVTIEVDVRPEITLPDFDTIALTVDPIEVTVDEVFEELDQLRGRFGTLVTVDRPAKTGDFAQLDLVATIDGREVDTAKSVSYEIGSGELIEGIDEALDALSAGETTTFESTLLGGDNEGQTAQITVTLSAVKERELPEADDDFAQIASEFDTMGELRDSVRAQIEKKKQVGQGMQARDLLVEKLLELVELPIPAQLVEDEVHRHLENEERLDDDEHRAEVAESSEKTFRTQILLDEIAELFAVQVSQDELTQYLVQGASQYGMEPAEFAKVLTENNQLPQMVGEVARNKALAIVLGKATVKDTAGKAVDLSEFTAVAEAPDAVPEETSAGAGEAEPASDDANAEPEAAEKPKKKKSAKTK